MESFKKFSYPEYYSLLFVLVLLLVSSCGDDKNSAGVSANLVRGEGIVADSVLAINVSQDRPDGITNHFFSDQCNHTHSCKIS